MDQTKKLKVLTQMDHFTGNTDLSKNDGIKKKKNRVDGIYENCQTNITAWPLIFLS